MHKNYLFYLAFLFSSYAVADPVTDTTGPEIQSITFGGGASVDGSHWVASLGAEFGAGGENIYVAPGNSQGDTTSTSPNDATGGSIPFLSGEALMHGGVGGESGDYGAMLVQFAANGSDLGSIQSNGPTNSNTTMFGGATGPVNKTNLDLSSAGIAAGTPVSIVVEMNGLPPHMVMVMGNAYPTVTYDDSTGLLQIDAATTGFTNAAGETFNSAFGFAIVTSDELGSTPLRMIAQTNHWVGDMFPNLPGMSTNAANYSVSNDLNPAAALGTAAARCGTTFNGLTGESRLVNLFLPTASAGVMFGNVNITAAELAGFSENVGATAEEQQVVTADTNFGVNGFRVGFNYTFGSPVDTFIGARSTPQTGWVDRNSLTFNGPNYNGECSNLGSQVYETNHFITFKEGGDTTAAVEALATTSETAWGELLTTFAVDDTDTGVTSSSPMHLCSAIENNKQWGGSATYQGFEIISLASSNIPSWSDQTDWGKMAKHELMHALQSRLTNNSGNDYGLVHRWFSEGIATYISGQEIATDVEAAAFFNDVNSDPNKAHPVECLLYNTTGCTTDTQDGYYNIYGKIVQYLVTDTGSGGAGNSIADIKQLYLDIANGSTFENAFATNFQRNSSAITVADLKTNIETWLNLPALNTVNGMVTRSPSAAAFSVVVLLNQSGSLDGSFLAEAEVNTADGTFALDVPVSLDGSYDLVFAVESGDTFDEAWRKTVTVSNGNIKVGGQITNSFIVDGTWSEEGSGGGGNTAPVITAGQNFSVSEDAANGATVGTVVATDDDESPFTGSSWTIVSGNGDGVFTISNSGGITIADSSNLDYETTDSYTLTLTVSDGTDNSAQQTVDIAVNDVAEASGQSLSLQPGWNMVSIHVEDSDAISDIEGQFSDVDIWHFDGTTWISTTLATLSALETGKGYFIRVGGTESGVVALSGATATGTPALSGSLQWQMVGFNEPPASVATYVADNSIVSIWHFNGAMWEYYIAADAGNATLTSLAHDRGYFVNMGSGS